MELEDFSQMQLWIKAYVSICWLHVFTYLE